LNIEKREANVNKNKFEDFHIRMSKSVYGKTMENVRKRQNIVCPGETDLHKIYTIIYLNFFIHKDRTITT
jgi:hypothetical protein